MNTATRRMLVEGAGQLGLHLTADQVNSFSTFSAELKKWSRKINLTAITDDADIAVKHFVDSLTLVQFLAGGGRLLDIGSGGGFPSIPLKIVLPDLEIVSLDAVEKKIIFQRHVARTLRFQGFEAMHARAEDLAATYGKGFEWVVSRAFSDLPSFVRLGLPFLRDSGVLLAMKGKGGKEEASASAEALPAWGVTVSLVKEFILPLSGDGRSIIVMRRNTG